MIARKDMKEIAEARLEDARVLAKQNRFEGAIYLCGYAVELGLKARICGTLHWAGWPSGGKEFDGYQSFRTHNLDVLLHLSGFEERIKTRLFAQWSAVAEWDPESRYNPVGRASRSDAYRMIRAAESLVDELCEQDGRKY
jgi:HEPN domain-containing protein